MFFQSQVAKPAPISLLFKRVLETADSVLDFSCSLLGLTFRLSFLTAQDLADDFFDPADNLPGRSLNPIFIHDEVFL